MKIWVYSHVEEEEAGTAVACHGKVCLSNKPVAGASSAAEPGMQRVMKDQMVEARKLWH